MCHSRANPLKNLLGRFGGEPPVLHPEHEFVPGFESQLVSHPGRDDQAALRAEFDTFSSIFHSGLIVARLADRVTSVLSCHVNGQGTQRAKRTSRRSSPGDEAHGVTPIRKR